jgi:Alpha-(1,6)-fucosyltransferase N- and catalytic domains
MHSTSDKSGLIDEAVASLHHQLDELQFQRNFDEAKFIVLDQDGFGFGAQFHRRVMGLQLGLMYSRTVVFVREYSPPYAHCFETTGKFTMADLAGIPNEVFLFSKDQPDKVAFFDFDRFWADKSFNRTVYEWVPPTFAALGLGRHFFEGQLLERFNYLPEYSEELEKIKQRIGFKSPIIGVHIRRGDKNTEEPYVPLRRFKSEILATVKTSGISRVFVTSDDPEVFDKLPAKDRIEYVYDREEPRYNNAVHAMLHDHPELAWQETMTALKIFDLLSSSNLIVGQSNAHLTLLAIARNMARTRRMDNHRLTPGEYTMSFSTAEPRDWGHVAAFKALRIRSGFRRLLRRCKRIPRRTMELFSRERSQRMAR